MNKKFNLSIFDAPTGTVITTDVEPAISVDVESRLTQNIDTLLRALGLTELRPLNAGNTVKQYKTVIGDLAAQVGEGEEIARTHAERKLYKQWDVVLKKFRKTTTAEAIQKSGREAAVNESDDKLVGKVQKNIKADFFATVGTGECAVGGATLQKVAANMWGALSVFWEDYDDTTPVFFVNPMDVAEYLGEASISTQTAFGFQYIEAFLGMGVAFVSAGVPKGTLYATVASNINGIYIPANGEALADFNMTTDESGLVGMAHVAQLSNASIETYLYTGVTFYLEDLGGVVVGSIGKQLAAVSNPSGNPAQQGYFVKVGDLFVKTADTTVKSGVTYYQLANIA